MTHALDEASLSGDTLGHCFHRRVTIIYEDSHHLLPIPLTHVPNDIQPLPQAPQPPPALL